MKKQFYFLYFMMAVLVTACNTEQLPGVSPYSSEKQLIELSFLKVNNPSLDKDYSATIEGQNVNIAMPKGINLSSMIPSFKISDKATLKIGDVELISDKTPIDLTKSIAFTVLAQNYKLTQKYFPSVISIGITPNENINATTSYQNYVNNNLYVDLSYAIPTTIFKTGYTKESYVARAYADFDKDGDMDIIAAAANPYGNSGVDVEYFKNNTFQFDKDQSVFTGGAPKMLNAKKIIVADLNKDGWLDVVIAGTGFDKSPFSGETIKILMNRNGKFETKDLGLKPEYYGSVTAGDIDNDGDIDLFVTTNQSTSKFMLNDGNGNFTYASDIYPNSFYNQRYFVSELYDINGDGYLDLVNAGNEQLGAKSMVLLGNASGNYITDRMANLPKVEGFGVVLDIDFIDYNKDGKIDLLLTRTGDGGGSQPYYKGYYLQLLQNNGNSFEDVSKTALSGNSDASANYINWVRVQDVDNDGDLDITTDDKSYGLEWINNNGLFNKK
ncbi:VCBS repeat-containing protein [Pedobacter sp. SD-b]|uniref:VCBS repeat-containing protein n=1 Tax=Pedobacter segetis TaxID=2793069 RepID=A0ABS1BII0_9SPHI|nr:VCBS repeat-containing protein [Pedobacter segetis]MBK0382652.1 VCBS repeat-containing protein [Pedobacter segetis]